MNNPFTHLGLSAEITAALADQGYEQPTAIQTAAIPKVLAGHDLLAAAQTGTGKTAAFMLPSLERLRRYATTSTSPAMHPVRMLVLTPTRELADQIDQNTAAYIKNLPLRQKPCRPARRLRNRGGHRGPAAGSRAAKKHPAG